MSELIGWPGLLVIAIGYLLGSIPFGLLTTRLAGKGDIRAIGSGNIGATNVLRTGSKSLAAITLLGDGLKGTAAVLLGSVLGPTQAIAAGSAAFLGHLFPVWLRFRGGKGGATYLGILGALDWRVALLFAVAWLGIAAAVRLSSAATLTASVLAPIALFLLGAPLEALATMVMTVILWGRHADNIRRLLAGTESRIGGDS